VSEHAQASTRLARVARWFKPSSRVTIDMKQFDLDRIPADTPPEDDDR
jgi:hypothetical protein